MAFTHVNVIASYVQGFLVGTALCTSGRPHPDDPKTTRTGGILDPPEGWEPIMA